MKKGVVVVLTAIAACGGSSTRNDMYEPAPGGQGTGASAAIDADAQTAMGGAVGEGAGGANEPVAGGAPGWSESPDKAHAKDSGGPSQGYPNTPTAAAITASGAVIVTGINRPQFYFMGEEMPACQVLENGMGDSAGTAMFFDSSGTLTSCTVVASMGDDAMNDLALDGGGYVDIVGSIGGAAYISGHKLPFHGELDALVTQLDLGGFVQWTRTFGYEGVQEAFGVATDAERNILVVGGFEGAIINAGDALNAVGSRSAFAIKLDQDGAWKWGRSYGGGWAIALSTAMSPSGNAYVVGQFDGPLDLGSSHYVSQGNYDMFLLALSAQGEILWSKAFGNPETQTPTRVAVDPQGNIAIVGRSTGPLDFGGGLIDAARESVFVASFAPDGTHRWSKQYAVGSETDVTPSRTSIAFDQASNVIVAGAFTGNSDFGNGALSSPTDTNVFVGAWSQTGAPMWSYGYGGDGVQAARALAYDPKGGMAIAGIYGEWVDFGAGAVGPTQGNGAMFVVKYPPW